MPPPHPPLASLTEAQRLEALKRFHLLCPFLEDGVPLTHIATQHQLQIRTLRRWVAQYRSFGLVGTGSPATKRSRTTTSCCS